MSASNVIAARIAEFLRTCSPFQDLPYEEVLSLAARAVVRHCKQDERIFSYGDPLHAYMYIVQDGAVGLFLDGEQRDASLIEQCGEGDLFGIQPLIESKPYLFTAIALEESLLYGIRADMLQPLAEQHPALAFYLARNYAGNFMHPSSGTGAFVWNTRPEEASDAVLTEVQPIAPQRAPVTCTPEYRIRDAADLMSREEVSSIIIVNAQMHPIGIVTDKDLRKYAATGSIPLEHPISDIMSSPVITLPPKLSIADVQMLMVKHRIHHLCITQDGANQSPVIGVITEHDILVLQANNPAVLIRNIRRARQAEDLRAIRQKAEALLDKYLAREVSMSFISAIITEIHDALLCRAIELCQAALEHDGIEKPDAAWCWLSLGSSGRAEQLLRTDQDHALIFDDVPPEQYPETKAYFLDLAGKVSAMLHDCGLEYCPAEMMASNPQWNLSLQQWKNQFSAWMRTPTEKAVLFCTIFFDYRPVYGHTGLAERLSAHIAEEVQAQNAFLSFLAKNALQNPPPLTFFRDFMVERSGEHKNDFDIKSRAMMPLCDAARVLSLHAAMAQPCNTSRRFERLAELEPQNRELYLQAAEAYEILQRFRTLQGLKKADSGRFFKPSELSKMERLQLRNCFQPIRDLQSLLQVRFQLAFFR